MLKIILSAVVSLLLVTFWINPLTLPLLVKIVLGVLAWIVVTILLSVGSDALDLVD